MKFQEALAHRAAGDVETKIAIQVWPPKDPDDLRQGRFRCLMCAARAFVVVANDEICSARRDDCELAFGVVKAPQYEDSLSDRNLVVELGELFHSAAERG